MFGSFPAKKLLGTLAQVVEQWTENPCVLGSTPRGTTSEGDCQCSLPRFSIRPVNQCTSEVVNERPTTQHPMNIIAYAHNGFHDKFGIPRQAREDSVLETRIVFTDPYRQPEAIRGIEGYSHLWLLWQFDIPQAANPLEGGKGESPSLTVRPPRLGGNTRMGVFATRSPFRPNPIGLTSVRLLRIEDGDLIVLGADLKDGTAIYDIKPYLPWTDCHPEATGGFAEATRDYRLCVEWGSAAQEIAEAQRLALNEILSQDPRPAYQHDPERVYRLDYADLHVAFRVADGILYVQEVRESRH